MPQQERYPYEPSYYGGNPVDPNQVYNRRAQLYYQQQRQVAGYSQQDPLRNSVMRNSTLSGSVQDSINPVPRVQNQEQRFYSAQQQAAYRDVGNRVVEGAGNFLGPIANFASTEAAGQVGFAMGGFAPGMAAYFAADAARSAVGEYVGGNAMARQFSRIKDLQASSDEFMAGTASSDPISGRMSRNKAKDVNRIIEKYARYASAYGEQNVNSDELRKEVATLSENDILENVKSAEDFARKFTSLRDGVKRMTEVLGKTFDEGSKLLGQYRNIGMDPQNATEMIDNINRMGTMSGSGFDKTNAAGMQSALQLQGTGLSPQAAIMVGAQGETSGEQIYQNGELDERAIYNLGGKSGLKQRFQQIMPRMMNSSFTRQAMMAAYDGEEISQERLQKFAEGEISPMDAYENFDSYNDMLSFRATRKEELSKMMEDDPTRLTSMMLQSATQRLQSYGKTFDNNAQLNQQLSMMMGMPKEDIKLLRAQMRTANEGVSRERLRRIEQGRGRLADNMGEIDFRFIEQSGIYRNAVDFGAESGDFLSDTAYDAASGISNSIRYMTTGRRAITEGSSAMTHYANQFVKNQEEEQGAMGGYYEGGAMSFSDNVDVFEEMKRRGDISEENIRSVSVRPAEVGRRGVTKQELKQMGVSDEKAEQLKGTRDMSTIAREANLKIFNTGNRTMDVMSAEKYQEDIDEQKSAARFGVMTRKNQDTKITELNESQREIFYDVNRAINERLETGNLDKKLRDQYNAGASLQKVLKEEYLKYARDEHGQIGEDELLAKGAGKVTGAIAGSMSQEYQQAVEGLGYFDTTGGGSGSYIDEAENLDEKATDLLTKASKESKFLQKRFSIDEATAQKTEEKIRKEEKKIKRSVGRGELPESAGGEQAVLERATKRVKEQGGKTGEAAGQLLSIAEHQSTLRRANDELEGNESLQKKFMSYLQLRRKKAEGVIENKQRFQRDMDQMRNSLGANLMTAADSMPEDVLEETNISDKQLYNRILTIGEETEGTQADAQTGPTRRSAQEEPGSRAATNRSVRRTLDSFKSLVDGLDTTMKEVNRTMKDVQEKL